MLLQAGKERCGNPSQSHGASGDKPNHTKLLEKCKHALVLHIKSDLKLQPKRRRMAHDDYVLEQTSKTNPPRVRTRSLVTRLPISRAPGLPPQDKRSTTSRQTARNGTFKHIFNPNPPTRVRTLSLMTHSASSGAPGCRCKRCRQRSSRSRPRRRSRLRCWRRRSRRGLPRRSRRRTPRPPIGRAPRVRTCVRT